MTLRTFAKRSCHRNRTIGEAKVSIVREKHSTAGRLIFQLTERSMKTTEEPARRLFRLRKLPARYAGLVMPFLLSIFMTCVVSLISTLHSVGLTNGLFNIWMGAWGLSWVIAFPTLLVVLPMVKAATGLVVEKT